MSFIGFASALMVTAVSSAGAATRIDEFPIPESERHLRHRGGS
jgi:hypothetical protein